MNGKNIFVTIEYVAKKILEAITGHKSDPQAHPNLSEQINVLLSMQNGFKLYKDFTEIGDNINNNTPLQTLIETMQDCSILVCNSNGGTAYKGLFGTLIVHKRDNWHADLKLTVDSGKTYTAYYNKDSGVGLRDFEEIATTEKTDISLLNGWVAGFPDQYAMHLVKTGNMVNIIACITGGVGSVSTGIATIPVEFRPKKTILGYADVIGGGYDNSRFLIIPNGTIQTNTEWDSSLIYQISFTYSIE